MPKLYHNPVLVAEAQSRFLLRIVHEELFAHCMTLPSKEEAKVLLEKHVQDIYQRHHALMVATAMDGYARQFGEDPDLWFVTGYLHDIDFEQHPSAHPGESLKWFREWGYPEEMIHAVEAHAYGYNGFTALPQTRLAAALLACDEISGIFYAYRKLNPVPYGQMKASSIRKKVKEPAFAAKVDRATITMGCEKLGVPLDKHIENLIGFFAGLD
jgi:putative nucleotidyltransferase with HDIG domain